MPHDPIERWEWEGGAVPERRVSAPATAPKPPLERRPDTPAGAPGTEAPRRARRPARKGRRER
jgi:hypothetical protein